MVIDAKRWVRFCSKFEFDPSSGCWNWTAGTWRKGYGCFFVEYEDGRRGMVQAHRVAYTMLVGPIPEGLVIDHLCRNVKCMNPRHLEAVTSRENSLRGNNVKTHCVRGHEFTPDNTYVWRNGGPRPARRCIICTRDLARRRRQAGLVATG